MSIDLRTSMLRSVLAFVLFLSGGHTQFADVGTPHRAPRLVLVYATCSVNKQYLGPYNPRIEYTPHLVAFGQHGRVFMRHQTESAQSGIAFASIWTGTQAMRHGIYSHPERLDDSNYLMAEAFAEHGYETYFWDRHSMASASLNYGQGVPPEHVTSGLLRLDDPSFVKLLARLQNDPNARAFVMTNLTVTHRSYDKGSVGMFCERYPRECRGITTSERVTYGRLFENNDLDLSYDFSRSVKRLHLTDEQVRTLIAVVELRYKACISYLDDLFGGVVDAVANAGLLDESLIVFTSDHGELLYRRNSPFQWTHGFMEAPEDLSVPLIIRGPGIPAGRYGQITRSIDIFPSVAALSGFNVPQGRVMGTDLSAAILKNTPAPRQIAYSHTTLVPAPFLEASKAYPAFHRLFPSADIEGIWVAARAGDIVYKLVRIDGQVRPEVFDWASDPNEIRNLYDSANRNHRAMMKNLLAYKQELVRGYLDSAQGRQTLSDEERVKRLRSLGYIH